MGQYNYIIDVPTGNGHYHYYPDDHVDPGPNP